MNMKLPPHVTFPDVSTHSLDFSCFLKFVSIMIIMYMYVFVHVHACLYYMQHIVYNIDFITYVYMYLLLL